MRGRIIENVLEKLVTDYAMSKFTPILEADVVGYLYHLLILEVGDATRIHLDTRICLFDNNKFDIVMGDVCYEYERPCIKDPEFVVEIKVFPIGFTPQQHRVHYRHVIDDDIPKLVSLAKPPEDRYVLLFDVDNYLKGYDKKARCSKIERIVAFRDEVDPLIKIIYVTRHDGELKWEIL